MGSLIGYPYPAELLHGARSALFLFGAAFLGANDAVWARDEGVRSTVVDVDRAKLEEMRPQYPATWRFVCADAFDYIRHPHGRWDVVSADPFTGDAANRCLLVLSDIAELARRAVTVTIRAGAPLPALDGWKASRFQRSPRADWLVLSR